MKSYADFMFERVDTVKPFDTNRNSPPVSSRTGLGINNKGAAEYNKARALRKAQNSSKSFVGSIRSNSTGAFNTQTKAPKLNVKPNTNFSSREANPSGTQTSSGLI